MGTVILSFSCILFSAVVHKKINTMNPMKSVLVMLGASAMAAPVPEPEAGLVADPAWAAAPAALGYAGVAAAPAALGYAGIAAAPAVGAVAAPAVGLGYAGYAAAPAVAAAPVAVAAAPAVAPVNIPAPAISVPAPYTTSHVSGPDAVSVHQPPPVVTKKIEYGTRPYVAAYDTTVIKPVLGDLDIAVPTALKGTVSHNAPITRVSKEPFVVNEPVPVERPYNVPYEVLKHVTKHVDVPTPVHVDAPYNVPVPTPVQGEPIIQKVTGPARVVHSHENRIAPAVHTGTVYGGLAHGYAAAPVAAVGAVGAIADPAWA